MKLGHHILAIIRDRDAACLNQGTGGLVNRACQLHNVGESSHEFIRCHVGGRS